MSLRWIWCSHTRSFHVISIVISPLVCLISFIISISRNIVSQWRMRIVIIIIINSWIWSIISIAGSIVIIQTIGIWVIGCVICCYTLISVIRIRLIVEFRIILIIIWCSIIIDWISNARIEISNWSVIIIYICIAISWREWALT